MTPEQAAAELGPCTFFYLPMHPPNFHGDRHYAVAVADQVLRYSNGLEKFCHKAPDQCKSLNSVFAYFQDLPDIRSCSVGDLIFRKNDKLGVHAIMVAGTGFINLHRSNL